MRLDVISPAGNDRGAQYTEQVLSALHQANPRRFHVSFEMRQTIDGIVQSIVCPVELKSIITSQMYAHYPECRIVRASREKKPTPAHTHRWTVSLRLFPDIFHLRCYSEFADTLNRTTSDPLTALLSTLNTDDNGSIKSSIRIVARPVKQQVVDRARQVHEQVGGILHSRQSGGWRAWYRAAMSDARVGRLISRIVRKLIQSRLLRGKHSAASTHSESPRPSLSHKLGELLFETHIELCVTGRKEDSRKAHQKLREMAGAFGQFSLPDQAMFHVSRIRRYRGRARVKPKGRGSLMTGSEIATMWHLPTSATQVPSLTRIQSREFEIPSGLPTPKHHPDMAILGKAVFRGRKQLCGILPDDRRRHLFIVGKTGMGKSTLLQSMLTSDIKAGRGCCLLDPHGDLCASLVDIVPKRRRNQLVVFDAGNRDAPLAFNPLSCESVEQRPLVASGVLSALKKLYGESWGPRMEYILRNALLAVLDVPGSTFETVLRMLSDAPFRKTIVSRCRDPIVRDFWEREFAAMPQRLQVEAVSPIQNKVGQMITHPILRGILGQPKNKLDLRKVMDDEKILLVNLSKGRIGEDASSLLGSLLISSLQIAAMGRAGQEEELRRDFYLFIDEFQNFATDSFATILSESRKYRLNLTIANQYLAQIPPDTLAAVFGNVGSLLAFQVGIDDAEVVASHLGTPLRADDLMSLPRFNAYARILAGGQSMGSVGVEVVLPFNTRSKLTIG